MVVGAPVLLGLYAYDASLKAAPAATAQSAARRPAAVGAGSSLTKWLIRIVPATDQRIGERSEGARSGQVLHGVPEHAMWRNYWSKQAALVGLF